MRGRAVSQFRLVSLGLCLCALSAVGAPEGEAEVDRILERSEYFLSKRRLPDGTVGSALRLKAANELRAKLAQMKSVGEAPMLAVLVGRGPAAYFSVGYYNGAPANGAYASFDAGETLTSCNGTLPAQLPNGTGVGRLALALDPNDSSAQTLYAAAAPPNTSGALLGVYKTVDGGQSWDRVSNQSLCGGQCWYDLAD